MPPKLAIGNPPRDALQPETVAEVVALDLRPPRPFSTAGSPIKPTLATMAGLGSKVFIAGSSQNGGSRRTRKLLTLHRVGCEGRIAISSESTVVGVPRLKGGEVLGVVPAG